MTTVERALQLAEICETRSAAPSNLDMPGYVTTNLLRESWAEIAEVLRAYSKIEDLRGEFQALRIEYEEELMRHRQE